MGERPTIFSAPMVKALLAGRKSQTRRIINDAPKNAETGTVSESWFCDRVGPTGFQWTGLHGSPRVAFTPRFAVGDRLYVREACAVLSDENGVSHVKYRATCPEGIIGRWRPSIHMPRWASRLTLNVTGVRVQRLQDISEEDAVAEGIYPFRDTGCYVSPKHSDGKWRAGHIAYEMFRELWNSLHGPEAWDANPWVCAISFSVESRNIDSAPTAPTPQAAETVE